MNWLRKFLPQADDITLDQAEFRTYLGNFEPDAIIGLGNSKACVIAEYLVAHHGVDRQDLAVMYTFFSIKQPFIEANYTLPDWAAHVSRYNDCGQTATASEIMVLLDEGPIEARKWRMKDLPMNPILDVRNEAALAAYSSSGD